MTELYEGKGFEKLYNVEGVSQVLIRDHYLIRRFDLTKNQKLDAEMGNITAAINRNNYRVYLLRKFDGGKWVVLRVLK